MGKSREKLEAEFLAEAKEIFDELMEWDENITEPDLSQIEEIVLKLRGRLGKNLAETILERQENRQPSEAPSCNRCGEKMKDKGRKRNQVVGMVGEMKIERAYYYCEKCRVGHFPPGSAVSDLGETLE